MLKSLYDWTMRLAERPSAEIWLFVISFVESSIFLVPAEVLFLPMAIEAGLEAGADRIIARIRGEALPAPATKPQGTGQSGFDLEDLAIFLFFAVPVGAAVLRSIFGRKLGALFMGGAVGAVALFITSSLLVAGLAGVVAMLVALFSSFSGVGSAARRGGGWGGGGWSSGGSGGWSGGSGGFSSGGGGDFGGGGASGDW